MKLLENDKQQNEKSCLYKPFDSVWVCWEQLQFLQTVTLRRVGRVWHHSGLRISSASLQYVCAQTTCLTPSGEIKPQYRINSLSYVVANITASRLPLDSWQQVHTDVIAIIFTTYHVIALLHWRPRASHRWTDTYRIQSRLYIWHKVEKMHLTLSKVLCLTIIFRGIFAKFSRNAA